MDTPKVSVVIAAYNHADFVVEAVESVLGQAAFPVEVVVTDDGSADDTAERLRAVARDEPRLRLNVFDGNRGACIAMNDALSRSRGDYVAVLNSDDRSLPGRLERQAGFLDDNPGIAAVFGLPRFITESGAAFTDSSHKDFSVFRQENRPRADWLRHFFFWGNCLCHPTAMVRRAVYAEVGGYDPRLAQLPDLDMWVRICARHGIHVMAEEMVEFRILSGQRNASAARPDVLARDAWERTRILERFLDLDDAVFQAAFRQDLLELGVPPDAARPVALARLALKGCWPAHRTFALDQLYRALGPTGTAGPGGPTCAEFHRLVGGQDVTFDGGR
ncbi:glycosyltransferase family 2 protein [Rhodospirillum centenum]|uniref:Glycosyl transferase, family 2, putative n=1 Tax=Rhodospirillum centenum (strain ATCC 51521 / SW) TaxID=414684 RepID=B6IS17_RHOCS|nr:glycosyltransferase [Rhodospirillum centenum]ACI98253.1 glycosyl transferase, family 2, putative [Rhodospirillum centenum SW]